MKLLLKKPLVQHAALVVLAALTAVRVVLAAQTAARAALAVLTVVLAAQIAARAVLAVQTAAHAVLAALKAKPLLDGPHDRASIDLTQFDRRSTMWAVGRFVSGCLSHARPTFLRQFFNQYDLQNTRRTLAKDPVILDFYL